MNKTEIIYQSLSTPEESLEPNLNKIICADAYETLCGFPQESVDLIITSPPYFLDKEYEIGVSFEKYLDAQRRIIKECFRVLKPHGSIYWNVAQTIIEDEIIPLGAMFYEIFKSDAVGKFYLKNWIIWHYEGGPNCKNRLTGRYENLLWFVKDKKNYTFNLDEIRVPSKWQMLGDKRCNPNGKNPTDFWIFDEEEEKMEAYLERENSVLEINRISNNNKREKTPHPCQFPEALVERVIKAATNENDIVLDIFNGSGTTTKVADDLKRRWIGIDKEETYCKIAKLRVEGNLQRKVINNKVHILNAETANESSETGQQSIFQISNY